MFVLHIDKCTHIVGYFNKIATASRRHCNRIACNLIEGGGLMTCQPCEAPTHMRDCVMVIIRG